MCPRQAPTSETTATDWPIASVAGFRFEAVRWLVLHSCGWPWRRPPNKRVQALQENKVLKNVRIAWIAAAMVVASPAFAGWPADQPAQLDLIGGQRIIREIVVDGRLIETGSDAAPANELRPVPNWIDGSGAPDRARQHSY